MNYPKWGLGCTGRPFGGWGVGWEGTDTSLKSTVPRAEPEMGPAADRSVRMRMVPPPATSPHGADISRAHVHLQIGARWGGCLGGERGRCLGRVWGRDVPGQASLASLWGDRALTSDGCEEPISQHQMLSLGHGWCECSGLCSGCPAGLVRSPRPGLSSPGPGARGAGVRVSAGRTVGVDKPPVGKPDKRGLGERGLAQLAELFV